ncbi:MAG: hypothetical protein OEY15_09600, partial [Myxococcales bacterium]|nr:hypothetical protein [Myxococcales bacterium]
MTIREDRFRRWFAGATATLFALGCNYSTSSGGSGERLQDSDIVVARSFDTGLTWSSPSAINEEASTDTWGDWAPQLATDTLGHWLAAWHSSSFPKVGTARPDLDILATRSADDGATWAGQGAVNTNASTDTGADSSVSIATDKLGTWIAVWASTDTLGDTIGDDNDILFARSMDDGATWSAPAPLNTTAATDTGTTAPPDAVNGVLGTAIAVAAGFRHSCAIQAGTGNVICWGDDYYGQATPPDAVNGVSGTATAVAAGGFHSCAIQAGTGNVVCWGDDSSGQATPPGAVGTATDITAGADSSCAIQAGTGNVVCWGDDSSGQATPPAAVNGVSGTATDIAAGYYHSCAIQAGTGNVVCWGDDGFDQATPPDAVDGVSGTATAVAAGGLHSCAIQAGTGNVVCWGNDGFGQATPPDAVNGVSGTATDIAGVYYHSCAIQAGTGNVVCWGYDGFGTDWEPQVATDGLGNWVVVWSSNNPLGDTIGQDPDILVARSTDDGLTWTAPSPVNSNASADRDGTTRPLFIDVDRSPCLATGQGVWIATWTAVNGLGDPKPRPPFNPSNDDLFVARSL